MMRLYLITFVVFFFVGCKEQKIFNIYEEMEVNKLHLQEEDKQLFFLNKLVVAGQSYKDDPLTPNLANGKMFKDKNITKQEPIEKYFKELPNYTFEHKITIFANITPLMLKYMESYSDIEARILQIKKFAINNQEKKYYNKKKHYAKKKSDENDLLPKKFLPPRLPDLSIGVDTPNLPEF